MNGVTQDKAAVRQRLRAAIAALSPADRDRASAQVVERIQARSEWRDARTVMLYVPLRDEINILPLLGEALHRRKTLLLPRFNPEVGYYEAAVVSNLAEDLTSKNHGVSEPGPACEVCAVNRLDVTVVPGLGFDSEGRRLGRGKGYYDRLLTDASGLLWGAGHDIQLTDRLPAEPHDVVLNSIVTPSRWVDAFPAHG